MDTAPPAAADGGDAYEWLSRPEIAQRSGASTQTLDRASRSTGFSTASDRAVGSRSRSPISCAPDVFKPTDVPTGLTGAQAVEVLRLEAQVADLLRDAGR
jgi:hypothetical protein